MLASLSARGGTPRGVRCARTLLLGLLLGGTLAGCQRNEGPVVFGFAGPLHTAYGASTLRGAQLAVKEINAAGGIHDRPLQLLALDDAALPDSAYAVADSLFDNPAVVAVVGHVNSGTTVQAAEVYQRGLPAVATSATSPEISGLGKWIFRVASSDSANAVQLARLANRIDVPTALLYQDEDYGRGLTESFRTAFASQGGRLLEADPYLPDTKDLTPFLERMKKRGVELVFIAGLEEDAARIIRQAHQVGLDARFLGGDGLVGLVNMGADFNGTLVGLLYHPDASPEAASFAERYRAAYHREADSFAALGYDATRLLAQAARQAGPSRKAIQRYLARVGRDADHPAFEGVTGTIRFDANGDPVDKSFAVGVIRGGKILLSNDF